MKVLSVIIPSYNMEKYLHKCLDSFGIEKLPAADSDLEVLIVNDGSKDATSAIAHEYAVKWPKVFRVIDKENGHHGSCVNRGLVEATGAFVRILDADDWFETENFPAFMKLLKSLVKGNDAVVDVVYSALTTITPEGEVLEYEDYDYPQDRVFTMEEIADKRPCRALSALTYRTSLLRELNYHQPEKTLYSDNLWTFVPQAALRTGYYFPKIIYRYLMGREGQSMSATVWRRNVGMMAGIFEKMVAEYERLAPIAKPVNKQMMQGSLLNIAVIMYGALFSYAPASLVTSVILGVDKKLLAVSPETYAELDKICVCERWHPICYVTLCRKHPGLITPTVALVRVLKSVSRMLHKKT